MFKSKNCINCIDSNNCYILNQIKRSFNLFSTIVEIQITDFDFKCSHYHEHLKQLKITDYISNNDNKFKRDKVFEKNFIFDNGFD